MAVILRALVYHRDQKLIERALWEHGSQKRQPVR
jgi:hypothetical protein